MYLYLTCFNIITVEYFKNMKKRHSVNQKLFCDLKYFQDITIHSFFFLNRGEGNQKYLFSGLKSFSWVQKQKKYWKMKGRKDINKEKLKWLFTKNCKCSFFSAHLKAPSSVPRTWRHFQGHDGKGSGFYFIKTNLRAPFPSTQWKPRLYFFFAKEEKIKK